MTNLILLPKVNNYLYFIRFLRVKEPPLEKRGSDFFVCYDLAFDAVALGLYRIVDFAFLLGDLPLLYWLLFFVSAFCRIDFCFLSAIFYRIGFCFLLAIFVVADTAFLRSCFLF